MLSYLKLNYFLNKGVFKSNKLVTKANNIICDEKKKKIKINLISKILFKIKIWFKKSKEILKASDLLVKAQSPIIKDASDLLEGLPKTEIILKEIPQENPIIGISKRKMNVVEDLANQLHKGIPISNDEALEKIFGKKKTPEEIQAEIQAEIDEEQKEIERRKLLKKKYGEDADLFLIDIWGDRYKKELTNI